MFDTTKSYRCFGRYPLFTSPPLKGVGPKVVTIFMSSHLRYFYLAQPTQKICGLHAERRQAIPPARQFRLRLVFHGEDAFDGVARDTVPTQLVDALIVPRTRSFRKMKTCRTGHEQLFLFNRPQHVFVPGANRRG